MSEELIFTSSNKAQRFQELIPQLEHLVAHETDIIANLANVSAALKEAFDFFWVGFYLVKGEQLVVGPFQGPIACTRIKFGKGVCGTAWKEKRTIVVPDVNLFPGHIACSSSSKSEIVIPIYKSEEIVAVLDIDSLEINTFDSVDKEYLEKIAGCISSLF